MKSSSERRNLIGAAVVTTISAGALFTLHPLLSIIPIVLFLCGAFGDNWT